ncbi:DnaD domain protein [Streptococcus dysgalactiae]|uniref:DnaD domain protein n=1 Tax=Streptococcus dysgalactiae TaxID=1334 RepID=UPI002330F547|nr:DnaD domain protein [Streptococcus dysgalactiae]WCE86601.1 DnaD domain protein [Streptococcus dysgalactiae]WCN26596.1 DnaD domain protein [Streptococcus dysgalactiae]
MVKKKTKIYFWLKFDKKFFDNLFIKRLKNISGGYAMTVIYIRLMLESIETDCILYYEGYFESLIQELALKLDVSEDDLNMTFSYFTKCGLIQIDENGNAILPQAKSMLEQESNWAKYKRDQRKLEKKMTELDNVQPLSNMCPTDIEIEKELKLDKELELELEQDKEDRFVDVVEANLGRGLVKFEFDMINDYLIGQNVSKDLFLEAVKVAVANNVRKFNYIARILDNWINDGIKTPEQAYQAQRDFKARKANKTMPSQSNVPDWHKENYVEQTSPEEQEKLAKAKKQMLERLNKLNNSQDNPN